MRRIKETVSSWLNVEPLNFALKSQVWCVDSQVSQLTREQMRAVEHEVTQQNTIALWHPNRFDRHCYSELKAVWSTRSRSAECKDRDAS